MTNTNQVEFDSNRYATDMGPSCSKCNSVDGDSLWVYLCQFPYSQVLGQCVCCHELVWFEIPAVLQTPNGTNIQTIKTAHRSFIAQQAARGLVYEGR